NAATAEKWEQPCDLDASPTDVVWTSGAQGATYSLEGGEPRENAPAQLPSPVADTYGSGDCFAAGLTFGLAQGLAAEEAIALGAARGAEAVTRRGAYGGEEGLPSG